MFPPERQEGRAVFRRRMSRFQEEANVGVEVLVILVVILLFFGGGGWYVSRPGYRWGGESWLGILLFLVVLIVLMRWLGVL